METKVIKKSIGINAPKEKVWDVLIQDKLTRMWYAEFSEGTYAETDWQQGSKVAFKDKSESGMVGTVVVNNPGEMLAVEYQGIVAEGKEDYDSNMAQDVKGGREIYRLAEKYGVTQLDIESDMTPEYFDTMSQSWDKALQKIKSLAESA
jgi:uncharacterized protein YndB with AHSA1/START domain